MKRNSTAASLCLMALALVWSSDGWAQPAEQLASPRLEDRVVALEDSEGTRCTGVILGKDRILTAGHCIEDTAPLVFLYPHQEKELLLTTSVSLHRHDATADIAILTPSEELPFSDLRVACPPEVGAKVAILGFPIGLEQATRPRATPLLSTATYVGGRYAPWNSQQEVIQRLEFTPELSHAQTGSSGSPVFIKDDRGEALLLGIYDGRIVHEGKVRRYYATTALPFLDEARRCVSREPGSSTPPSLSVTPGACVRSDAKGLFMDGACKEVASVNVEYAHLPDRFPLNMEIYDAATGNLVADKDFEVTENTGSHTVGLSLRHNNLHKQHSSLLLTVRVTNNPSVRASLGPIRVDAPVTMLGQPAWAGNQLKIMLALPAIKGKLTFSLMDVSTGQEVYRSGTTIESNDSAVVRFTLEFKDLSVIPKAGARLLLGFEDGSTLEFKDLIPPHMVPPAL